MSQHNRKQPKPTINNDLPFRTAYSPPRRVGLSFSENSRWTKQSFREECDVNKIMDRYLRSGEMPVMNQTAPQYLDVSGIEYQSAMEFVAGAQTLFNELPSNVRNRFANDPGMFLDFCSNENNRPEMARMGLLRHDVALAYIQGSTTPSKPLKTPEIPSAETPSEK